MVLARLTHINIVIQANVLSMISTHFVGVIWDAQVVLNETRRVRSRASCIGDVTT